MNNEKRNQKKNPIKKIQILVVEGEVVRARSLCLILAEIGGYQPLHAPTVLRAVQEFNAQSFDLIILNTTIQKSMDGLKLAKLLLLRYAKPRRPLVIMLTLEGDRSTVQQSARLGAVDYIVYPYDPKVFLQRVQKALAQRQGMNDDQIRQGIMETLEKILDLPTISPVHSRIEALAQNRDSSAEDMARVIELDPSITAKILRLSNSAFFGFARRILSVKDAVSLLGFQSVRAAVTAVSTFEALGRIEESPHFNRKAFWRHSIGCGAIAIVLAGKVKKVEIDPDQAFVAGILHDVGKVVLDGYFPDEFGQVLQAAAASNRSIFEAEKEHLPVTHEEVGRHLAERWNLPELLIEVIGTHNSLSSRKAEHAPLVYLIHVADARCRQLKVGNAGDKMIWEPHAEALAPLGITNAALADWTTEMESEIKKAESILELV